MDVFRSVASFPAGEGRTVLTVGNFDGVHLAHREICRLINAEAARRGARSAVLTFDPHPLSVVAPERCPALMTALDEKLARLEEQGVSAVVVHPFTPELARTPAEEFVRRLLHEGLRAGRVVVGFNFRFGKGRAGDVGLLRAEGERLGFETQTVEPYMFEGRRVSSTEIRRLLASGEVEEAAKLLGQPHLVAGLVVPGEGRGRTIGIPTANLETPPVLIPANGVYACWARIGERASARHPAVTNIGRRPTFGGERRTIEAHLLEGGRDVYGETLRLEFVSRLREERKFSGPEALAAQIRRDTGEARGRLGVQG
ncbi:MAG: riboflavin biosynthesis protein RibF [Candidatus Tectomicrobia bacterium RIFCSPLOWO2_12_FULL_69_37]|nr:MAG: riboflavin biosynthesis protein RibF [Candidatus Tectomicrobia bacterium RIFCSPLOWO2_12_FULL_69_37]